MNIGDVKTTIRRGNNTAQESSAILQRVRVETTETTLLADHTLHDSRDEDVEAGLDLLTSIDSKVDEAVAALDSAIRHADAYLAGLG